MRLRRGIKGNLSVGLGRCLFNNPNLLEHLLRLNPLVFQVKIILFAFNKDWNEVEFFECCFEFWGFRPLRKGVFQFFYYVWGKTCRSKDGVENLADITVAKFFESGYIRIT